MHKDRSALLKKLVIPVASAISLMAHTSAIAASPDLPFTGGTVDGWPNYIAMGAIGGPDTTPATDTASGGNDDFQGRPIDVAFKYAGENGNGDPGIIDPPTNVYRMTVDMNTISQVNQRPTRVSIVEYTAQMSGGENVSDFTNGPAGESSANPDASYIMGRHFISLAADAEMMARFPVSYDGTNYYGSMILNPDLLGAMQQNDYIDIVNATIAQNPINTAVAQAVCVLGTTRSYTNTFDPNGLGSATYIGKKYTGTPVQILKQMLDDGYPAWSIEGQNDPFWNIANNNLIGGTGSTYSQMGQWFNSCVSNPQVPSTIPVPSFSNNFNGWVQANNWLIRNFSQNNGLVTYGWQDNMWAIGSGFWLHKDLSDQQITATYSQPVSDWLNTNAPDVLTATNEIYKNTKPDFFVFDRYEMDDSAGAGEATLYNARSWDNYLKAVGGVSKLNNNIPVMRECSEFCVTLKILQRHHIIQSPFKING